MPFSFGGKRWCNVSVDAIFIEGGGVVGVWMPV